MGERVSLRSRLLELLRDAEGDGLQLSERLDGAGSGVNTDLYSVLRKLEADGLIESYASLPLASRGGRPQVYRITAAGRAAAALPAGPDPA